MSAKTLKIKHYSFNTTNFRGRNVFIEHRYYACKPKCRPKTNSQQRKMKLTQSPSTKISSQMAFLHGMKKYNSKRCTMLRKISQAVSSKQRENRRVRLDNRISTARTRRLRPVINAPFASSRGCTGDTTSTPSGNAFALFL
ncbi:hypothetical protein DMN91_003163 [Ooceraea biroi]|uniref:Uncharacterized protein n=1 Tax=Ooceraea biroi TaxID=2015173 RepID=A0A3L8DX97_OOCBI|nr:uncharacterized protein LOC105283115 [Ooceraea biroi]RLU25071.1 hypothetical protein DMN91_003163 [Ooceraea biroi]